MTHLSAKRLAALVNGGEVSPVEIVEAYFRRVELLNPSLNAIVTLAPDAVERAKELESKLSRARRPLPLAGVPVTVKDTIEVKGLRTTFGSRLFAEHVPQRDAPAVARLRRAGAIITGKTNASELALEYTADNSVFGRTNNPFDERRTPGGSSGGCAAAVCACLCAAGLGSDLVGSIRIPAHFCGVAGLRPTTGRVPGGGHLPPVSGQFAQGASLGPIARRVEDLALLFNVLAASDKVGVVDVGEISRIDNAVARLRGRRVAWYADDGSVPVTKETRKAVEAAAHALEDAGMICVEERPSPVERATEFWLALYSSATEGFLQRTYEGHEEIAGSVARLLMERSRHRGARSSGGYFEALRERERLRAKLLEWMKERPLLLAPVGAVPALEHDTHKVSPAGVETFSVFRAFGYAQAFNVFDLPAVCVRAGWTREGLPIGVQVVARPHAEGEALAGARIIEEALGGWEGVPENLSKAGANPL